MKAILTVEKPTSCRDCELSERMPLTQQYKCYGNREIVCIEKMEDYFHGRCPLKSADAIVQRLKEDLESERSWL